MTYSGRSRRCRLLISELDMGVSKSGCRSRSSSAAKSSSLLSKSRSQRSRSQVRALQQGDIRRTCRQCTRGQPRIHVRLQKASGWPTKTPRNSLRCAEGIGEGGPGRRTIRVQTSIPRWSASLDNTGIRKQPDRIGFAYQRFEPLRPRSCNHCTIHYLALKFKRSVFTGRLQDPLIFVATRSTL